MEVTPTFVMLVAYPAFMGVPSLVVFAVANRLWRGRRSHLSFGLGLATGVLSVLVAWFAGRTHATVQIDSPPDSYVAREAWQTLEGTVSPPGARVYVLVHPGRDRWWWVQARPLQSAQGAWKVDVNLGTPDNGGGECYQVVALASDVWDSADLLRGRWPVTGQRLVRPPALPCSNVLTVWRRR